MSFETALNSLLIVGRMVLMIVLAPVASGVGGLLAFLVVSGLLH